MATVSRRAMPIFSRSATLKGDMKQEIHFVTGKGGVGKSTVAAALAYKKAQEGRRVLLVELGDQSFYQDFLELPPVGFQALSIQSGLSVALWTGQTCLREYASYLIKIESLARLFFENAAMKAFVNIAPGLPELAILGKITSGPRQHGPALPFDCLVVDAYATGHFVALLNAPRGMAEAIQFGPMGEQSRSIEKCLRNPDLCHFHIVTLPEELPVKEAQELQQKLSSEFSIQSRLIVNKVLDVKVSSHDLKNLKKENSDQGRFASYLDYQLEHQQQMLEKAREFAQDLQLVPLHLELNAWSLVEKIAGGLR